MKYMRVFIGLLIGVITLSLQMPVYAMETGFSTEAMPDAEKDKFISNVNIMVLHSEPQKRGIKCFDVSDEGLIAIGTSNSEQKTISVYTIDGDFQYGYTFHSNGSFGVEWDGDNLIIYWVRSDVAVCVDREGEIMDAVRIQNTVENNTYWNHSVFANERTVGDYNYSLKDDGIFGAYTQLAITNGDGEESILYEVSSEQFAEWIVIIIGIVLFVGAAVFVLVRETNKLKPEREKYNNHRID